MEVTQSVRQWHPLHVKKFANRCRNMTYLGKLLLPRIQYHALSVDIWRFACLHIYTRLSYSYKPYKHKAKWHVRRLCHRNADTFFLLRIVVTTTKLYEEPPARSVERCCYEYYYDKTFFYELSLLFLLSYLDAALTAYTCFTLFSKFFVSKRNLTIVLLLNKVGAILSEKLMC